MLFKKTPLGDFADVQGGYAYKSKDLQPEGFCPVVKIKNVRDGFLSLNDVTYVNEDLASQTTRFLCETGDVLISMTGSGPNAPDSMVGRVARVKESDLPALINQRVGKLVIREKSSISQNFLYYCLSSKSARNYLVSSSTGSANQANINADTIKSLQIPKISYKESVEIGEFLSKFDDKIELNKKMNQTLEEIAKAIFKSWFVDFDPVRAKAEGRPTGLPPELSDLFPDELVDSEIGEIPKGWETSTFADVLEIQGGFAFKSKDFGEDGDPVIKIKNIRGDGTVDQFDCDRVANPDKKLDRFLLRDGDAVIAMTGATVGKVGLMSVNDEKFYLNQRVGRLLPKSSSDRCWYSVLLLSSEKTKDFIEGYAYGSAQPNISSKDIGSIPNVTPRSELVESFNQIVSPLFLRTLIILKENDLLSELRDTLLPKLISGELRIPDAEKFLEEAGL